MASETINCTTHGKMPAAAVCCHITKTLQSAEPVGFNWHVDEEGDYQAFCDACWNASDEEWERMRKQVISIICEACFLRAAGIAGADVASTKDPSP